MFRFIRVSLVLLVFLAVSGVSQNAPISTIGNLSTYTTSATLQITAVNFTFIRNCDLKILYDTTIAKATSVSTGTGVNGSLMSNITVPGEIVISWFRNPALTLSGNPVIFKLVFSKKGNGTTPVTWFDDGLSCRWANGNYANLNDIPYSTYYINGALTFLSSDAPHSILPALSVCNGTFVDVPVRTTGFSNIGKLNLAIRHDATRSAYFSATNVSGFPGLTVSSPSSGNIQISGQVAGGTIGFSLPDSAVLVVLHFFLQNGYTALLFDDNGTSCQYTGPPPLYYVLSDNPFANFYFDGGITGSAWPGDAGPVFGPPDGRVCVGQSRVVFAVDPIANAQSYSWSFPPGYTISTGAGTNVVGVDIGATAISGSVIAYGTNNCGSGSPSPPFPVLVNFPPRILVQPETPDSVIAGQGTAQFVVVAEGTDLVYQWQEFKNSWQDVTDGGVYNGTESKKLTINQPPVAMNGYKYRCKINGFCAPEVFTDGSATLHVSTLIGIDKNLPVKLSLSVFPNPVSDASRLIATIPDGASFTLTMKNMLGDEIFTVNKKNYTEIIYTIPLLFTDIRNSVAIAYLIVEKNGQIIFIQQKIMSLK